MVRLGSLEGTMWSEDLPNECYEALTFNDLEIGDKYISFPLPGDNKGHGGFKNGSYIFRKIKEISDECNKLKYNSVRLSYGDLSYTNDRMLGFTPLASFFGSRK